MFNDKRIKELEKENVSLREQIFYLKSNVEGIDRDIYMVIQPEEHMPLSINYCASTNIYSHTNSTVEGKKISVKEALELLIKQLGYEITYHQSKSSKYTLDEIPKKRIKKQKKKVIIK